ncbi:MAG TPA: MnmC family methyltransferase [Bdellovibrionota bacterium]|jgi:tRNA U34 5-methylaminomethyl-2-thiouridine-forming methyltransferase MnmC
MRFELRTTADGSLTVFDHEAGECFKSRHAARSEAEHVFYRPAVVDNQWLGKAAPFRVVELGFGLGTNFLHFSESGFQGEFVSIERDLSGVEFFLDKEKNETLETLVQERILKTGNLTARILKDDFKNALERLARENFLAHAVLFDPFSPKANPEAWTAELFRLAAAVLAPGGRLVTYSVSRAAKDAALGAGLAVEKHDLPPSLQKRSALVAIKPA